ncbi:MAG: hypothetical protein U0232_05795 [Thermomicrobiales bacterium]
MAEAMEDGAFGISYALIYPPESYADTDEIVEVAKVAGRYGGVYITHLRSEGTSFRRRSRRRSRSGSGADCRWSCTT